jgi:Uma2 family endonuclease
MSTSITRPHATEFITPDLQPGLRPIPSLGQLYEWTSRPDHRVVIRGVDWLFYEQLVDSIPEGANIQVDFDGKDLEIMSPGPMHDGLKTLLARFLELTADELEIPFTGLGQTTWKRPEIARGLEADECYYFLPEKLAVADEALVLRSNNVADYPNPDLAIEVDVSPSEIDRPAIYAALQIAEVWRFDGELEQIVIERLIDDGTYHTVPTSQFLPVSFGEISRWVLDEDRRAQSAWARRLRTWVRAELGPRMSQ